jgi:hypothetical protein
MLPVNDDTAHPSSAEITGLPVITMLVPDGNKLSALLLYIRNRTDGFKSGYLSTCPETYSLDCYRDGKRLLD